MKPLSLGIAGILIVLLSSCATVAHRTEAVTTTVDTVYAGSLVDLNLGMEDFLGAGYAMGDRIVLEVDGVMVKAVLSDAALPNEATLVVGKTKTRLLLPTAVQRNSQVIIFPFNESQVHSGSSLTLSGNFVFTF
ncbi:MAG: hypothetical protein AB7C91_03030 [Sphaerochaeta sp.]|uniref:hypothetical protein n=1 Tax=Sphaerochaeta sp. TaxID=1972642 RepID=UPI002FC9B774